LVVCGSAGDRLAWIVSSRPNIQSLGHVLVILDFWESAIVIGETNRKQSLEEIFGFGSLPHAGQQEENVAQCAEAVSLVWQMGRPRTLATYWGLG
jgi:hypothetical protein